MIVHSLVTSKFAVFFYNNKHNLNCETSFLKVFQSNERHKLQHFSSSEAPSVCPRCVNGHPRPLLLYFRPFQTSIQFYNKKMLKIIHLACCTGIQTHYLLDMSLLPLPLVQCCQNDIWPRIFVANIKLYAMIVEGRFRRGHYLLFMAIVIQKGGQFPEAF